MNVLKDKTDADLENDLLLKAAYKFEYWVVLVLVVTIGLVTLLTMTRLFFGLYDAIFVSWDITNRQSIPLLFGMVMTVLIALEFGNSILKHIREHSTIIQAQEVMIIDMSEASAWQLGALGILAVSLASAYWLMRDS